MIIRKNQILIFVLALLLITAGYLGFGKQNGEVMQVASDNIDESENWGDATLVNSPALVPNETETKTEEIVGASNARPEETNAQVKTQKDDYFSSSKLERENMYSQMLASYQKIIDNTEMSSEQKSIAQNEIVKINNEKNAIMIIENLIKTKGFSDVVIFINNGSINVVVRADTLSQDAVAQIQNIVSRELNAEINNIHIITK